MSRTVSSIRAVPRASRHSSAMGATPPNVTSACLRAALRRQAASLQPLGFAFEMELQLLTQVGLAAIAEEQGSQPASQRIPEAHGQVLCITRLTPADRRSHFETSTASWARPALVKRVEAGAAIVLGRAPVRRDPALVLEAVERRIERALPDPQQVVRDLLDALRDRPAVHRLERDRPHDQEVEGPLQDVGLVAHAASLVDWHREQTRHGHRKVQS